MSQTRLTKNELKLQRDNLARFQRYLPTLVLKKQQLQRELQNTRHALEEALAREAGLAHGVAPWAALFCDESGWEDLVGEVTTTQAVINIAGVDVPELTSFHVLGPLPDPTDSPAWFDEARALLTSRLHARAEAAFLREREKRLAAELETTAQRVNLFEKVKIPACREHIRAIRIYLGDQQTAAVARAKIIRGKTSAKRSIATEEAAAHD